MNKSNSPSGDTPVSISFCGYSCWGKKPRDGGQPGREVMRELLGVSQDAEVPDQTQIQLADGQQCTVTKIQGCLGACGRLHPTVRIEHVSGHEQYLKGSSTDVILNAIEEAKTF